MFTGAYEAAKANRKAKVKQAGVDKKLMGIKRRRAARVEEVARAAMCDRLGQMHVCAPQAMYSAPLSSLVLTSARSSFDIPATKRQMIDHDDEDGGCSLGRDIDAEIEAGDHVEHGGGHGGPDEKVWFRVVLKNPKDKKTVQVAPGAGSKILDGMAVSLHKPHRCHSDVGDTASVFCSPDVTHEYADHQHFILRDFRGGDSIEHVLQNTLKFKETKMCWTLDCIGDLALDGSMDDNKDQVCKLVTSMVLQSAAYSNTESLGYSAQPPEVDVLRAMEHAGLASRSEDRADRWFYTDSCKVHFRSVFELASPERVFAVRSHLALKDLTGFELMTTLGDRGWQWRAWVPKSQRRRNDPETYQPQRQHAPLIWYSNLKPSLPYMQTLLQCDELYGAGLPEIPHGCTDLQYQKLLHRDFRGFFAMLEDAGPLPDVEVDRDMEPGPDDIDGLDADDDDLEAQLAAVMEMTETEEEPAAEEPEEPQSPPTPPPAVDPAAAELQIALAVLVAAQDPFLSPIDYGVFTLTPKQPNTIGGGRFGGYQGTCPYHKKNSMTDCKRWFGFKSADQNEQNRTIRLCKLWCIEGVHCTRQAAHVAMPMLVEDCPDEERLDALRINGPHRLECRRMWNLIGKRCRPQEVGAEGKAKLAEEEEQRQLRQARRSLSLSRSRKQRRKLRQRRKQKLLRTMMQAVVQATPLRTMMQAVVQATPLRTILHLQALLQAAVAAAAAAAAAAVVIEDCLSGLRSVIVCFLICF